MHYKLTISASILAGCVSACVPLQDNQNLKSDLTRIQNRVTTLEQHTASLAQKSTDKEMLRRQAEQRAELDSTHIDIQTINGRIADQEKALQQLRQEVNLHQSDLEERLVHIRDQLDQLEKRDIGKDSSSSSISTLPATAPSITKPISHLNKKETYPQIQQTVQDGSRLNEPETLYSEALKLVQQDMSFSAAREKFVVFVKKYPEHELAVNAMYWIGETLYGNKKYENAILQFQDVIQMYPQHPKIPAALLKQGLAFYELGDTRNAKIILQKVQDKYPDSQEAEKARQRLEIW